MRLFQDRSACDAIGAHVRSLHDKNQTVFNVASALRTCIDDACAKSVRIRETERKDVNPLKQAHTETSRRYSRGIPPTVFPADVSRNVLDTSPTNFPRMCPMYRASGMRGSVRRDSPGAAWEKCIFALVKNRERRGGKHSARHDGAPLTRLHVGPRKKTERDPAFHHDGLQDSYLNITSSIKLQKKINLLSPGL